MPKDILNIVYAPKKLSELTNVDEIASWEQARKKEILYHSKPFLVGNASFIRSPSEYPNKKAPEKNKELRNLIHLWWGDITKLNIECIVNSANIKLKYGGGVCGAIFRATGPDLGNDLKKEIEKKYPNGCNVTECVVTDSFKLPTKYIIHAVGPAQIDYNKLSKTYKNVLKLCIESNIKEICFCCIGCGTHSLPIKQASKIAVYSVIKYLIEPFEFDENKDKKDDNVNDKEEKKDDGDNDNGDNNKEEIKNVKFGWEYFDKIVFNCFREDELNAYKYWLTEQLG